MGRLPLAPAAPLRWAAYYAARSIDWTPRSLPSTPPLPSTLLSSLQGHKLTLQP